MAMDGHVWPPLQPLSKWGEHVAMKEEDIRARVDVLLAGGGVGNRVTRSTALLQGTLTIMGVLYGPGSIQAESLAKDAESIRASPRNRNAAADIISNLAEGALRNIKGELDAGIVGTLQKEVTRNVLTDFLQLARAALDENGDDAKNVAAVLAAAVFEDTIRRIAAGNGLPHIEKLQNVIDELKNKGLLRGTQVGVASTYLNFRNSSLHAQWGRVERESVASVLAFVEELLRKHFP
jgi:hypothetical protein